MLRTIKTKYGILEGVPCGDPRITCFWGVPYAKPPVAELRWAAPQEPESTGTEVSAPEIQTGTAPHPELQDEPPAPEQQNGTAPHPELQDEQSAPESQDGTVPAPALHPLNPQAAEIPRI